MKVVCLRKSNTVYSSNSYLVLGDWNRLDDVNAVIDAGPNPYLVTEIEGTHTGFGKVPVEQIVLTHGHSDHTAGAAALQARYGATVCAYVATGGVDRLLADGERLRLGDREHEVIHAPVHSSDSICLYCADEGVLFTGDTPLRILTPTGTHDERFAVLLERLLTLDVRRIYPGHDEPITSGAMSMLRETLRNVNGSIGRQTGEMRATVMAAPWAPVAC